MSAKWSVRLQLLEVGKTHSLQAVLASICAKFGACFGQHITEVCVRCGLDCCSSGCRVYHHHVRRHVAGCPQVVEMVDFLKLCSILN